MKLTPYEQDMLDGKFGRFKQIALENVLKYARVVGAESSLRYRIAAVTSGHIALWRPAMQIHMMRYLPKCISVQMKKWN